jgi:ArsR family transcriptional regulator, cadmium/lead-responsive transcriptional repressor
VAASADVGAVFAALADPTRRQVVQSLSAGSTVTASALARDLPVTRQAVSKHLAFLHDAGLVACERRGREAHYRLTPAPLTEAASWMAAVGAEWDDRLEALRAHLARR